MRILVIHSRYRTCLPSGENVAVTQQIVAMRRIGLDVVELTRDTDTESASPFYTMRAAGQVMTGIDGRGVLSEIRQLSPDIVNVHNLSPNFGTRWLGKLDAPAILTLHNFRFTCANGLLFRGSEVCTKCVNGSSVNAVRFGCFQKSRLRSIPWALSEFTGGSLRNLLEKFDALIAQSSRVEQILMRSSIETSRVHLVPGFVERFHSGLKSSPEIPRFLFVGRNTPEKGLGELLESWPSDYTLDVIGTEIPHDRPSWESANINFLGHLERTQVRALLPDYSGLVFPGRAWEGAVPLVVREALEAGIPVIARSGSSASDFIAECEAGLVYKTSSVKSLRTVLETCVRGSEQLRRRARAAYESRLSIDAWQASFVKVLDGIVSSRK